jgi:hypothetical protein
VHAWSSIRHPGGHLHAHGAARGGGMVALATSLIDLICRNDVFPWG